MEIAILIPTRERPKKFKRMLESLRNTAPGTKVYVYFDSDDNRIEEYELTKINYTIGDPISISKSWNIIAEKAYNDGADIFIMGNDDLIYRTPNWDQILVEKVKNYPHPYYCMWFKDGIKNERHATFPIVSRQWYELIGCFTPGIFNHQYNDTWLFDIAKRAGVCCYIDEIYAQHDHYVRGGEMDSTYMRVIQNNYMQKDSIIFEQTQNIRNDIALKIQEKINEYCSL